MLNTSIESNAQTTYNGDGEAYGSTHSYNNSIQENFGLTNLYTDAQAGLVYKLEIAIRYEMDFGNPMYWRNIAIRYGDIPLISVNDPDSGTGTASVHYVDRTVTVYMDSNQINGKSFNTSSRHIAQTDFGVFYFNSKFTYNVISVVPLSAEESDQYNSGYNAGFSDGTSVGYDNGYSDGFLEGEENGFLKGQNSVDTDSYFNEGYQVGFNAAYNKGYNDGYIEGKKAVQDTSGGWGVQKSLNGNSDKLYGLPFYVSSHGLIDMEEYRSGSNGYFYNVVPGTYKGTTEIRYKMPVSSMNSPYGAFVSDSGCTEVSFVLPNVKVDWDIDTGNGTLNTNRSHGYLSDVYVTYGGKKYYGVIGSNYVNFDFVIDEPVDKLLFSDSNFQITFVIDHSVVIATDADVSLYVGVKFSPYISFDSFKFYIKPYYKYDSVSANIKDQTEQITGNLEEQKEIQQGQLEEQKEQTETQKGIASSIKEFFSSFFDNLINSIIHVIVPTKEEMGELFNRLNDFFAETFGFLYYPFDFIIDAFNIFLEADSETGLTLPGFSIMGYEVWGNQTYDITSEPVVGEIFGYVRMGTGAMLAMWFVNYLRNFFDKRFGGGGN